MTPLSKLNILYQQKKNRSLQVAKVLKPTDKNTAITNFLNKSNRNQMSEKATFCLDNLIFANK